MTPDEGADRVTQLQQPTVVFLHLPKAAGTSLRIVLSQRYKHSDIYDEPPAAALVEAQIADLRKGGGRGDGPLPPPFAPRFLSELASLDEERRRSLRLVMGHFWYGVHELLHRPATYVTLLRDPVDRVLSLYAHRARVQGLDVSLEQYVKAARDPQVVNDQVRRLGGDPSRALEPVPVDGNTLELAKERLREHFPVVGVAEDFEGTLRLLGDFFGWSDELPVVSENVSGWRPRAEDVPVELMAEIRELNALDLELYAFARQLMGERLGRIARPDAVGGDRAARPVRFPPVIGEGADADDDWHALVFLHIPKTAGTNLREVIKQQYEPDTVLTPEPGHVVPAETPYFRYLETGQIPTGWRANRPDPNRFPRRVLEGLSPKERTKLKVVMGHVWFGIDTHLPRPTKYFTLLRDPVERVLSIFYHRARAGLGLDLEEYVATGRDYEIDNGQTRYLCGPLTGVDILFGPCTTRMLETAKGNLREHFAVVGISERFDESLLLMSRVLGWHVPWYDLHQVNRGRPRGDQVARTIRQDLAERNRYDAELYGFAEGLFEEKLEALAPPIDERTLQGFRRSNLLHRSTTIRRAHPLARPVLRAARSIRRRVTRLASRVAGNRRGEERSLSHHDKRSG